MNNDLEQFSEERLKELAEMCESKALGFPASHAESAALARIALAVKQAKPVGYFVHTLEDGVRGMTSIPDDSPLVKVATPLYTTPQPAHTEVKSPVIPDGWIKCSERMPSKVQCVSISDGHLVGVWRYRGWWPDFDGNGCASTSDPLHLIKNITHWMPLPAAPKPESE